MLTHQASIAMRPSPATYAGDIADSLDRKTRISRWVDEVYLARSQNDPARPAHLDSPQPLVYAPERPVHGPSLLAGTQDLVTMHCYNELTTGLPESTSGVFAPVISQHEAILHRTVSTDDLPDLLAASTAPAATLHRSPNTVPPGERTTHALGVGPTPVGITVLSSPKLEQISARHPEDAQHPVHIAFRAVLSSNDRIIMQEAQLRQEAENDPMDIDYDDGDVEMLDADDILDNSAES